MFGLYWDTQDDGSERLVFDPDWGWTNRLYWLHRLWFWAGSAIRILRNLRAHLRL